jgi:ATP-dependent RNA helicase RhlE
VFTRTPHGATRGAEYLEKAGESAAAIHGNKSQNARERALSQFKTGQVRILVATDIAARGIDIEDITHVINYDLPEVPEQYVHRIGRTARAGADGTAISFCDPEEIGDLREIERLIRKDVPPADGHVPPPWAVRGGPRPPASARPDPRHQAHGDRRGGQRRGGRRR